MFEGFDGALDLVEASASDVELLVVVVLCAEDAALVVADDDLDAGYGACSFVLLDDAGNKLTQHGFYHRFIYRRNFSAPR